MRAKRISAIVAGCLLWSTLPTNAQTLTPQQQIQENIQAALLAKSFTNPTPVQIQGYSGSEMEPFISRDGLYMFFNNMNSSTVNTNIYYATAVTDSTFTYVGQLGNVDTSSIQAIPSMDINNNFFFVSPRTFTQNRESVYEGVFSSGTVNNITTVQGITPTFPGQYNLDAEISKDGQTLYYAQGEYNLNGPPTTASIMIATLQSDGSFAPLSNSAAILQSVNAVGLNYAPSTSVDGLELFFTRYNTAVFPAPELYVAARLATSDPFGMPQVISAATGFSEAPSLTVDGKHLYYHTMISSGTFQIYELSH